MVSGFSPVGMGLMEFAQCGDGEGLWTTCHSLLASGGVQTMKNLVNDLEIAFDGQRSDAVDGGHVEAAEERSRLPQQRGEIRVSHCDQHGWKYENVDVDVDQTLADGEEIVHFLSQLLVVDDDD